MASILIASDLRDDFVETELPEQLGQAGHTSEVIHPLERIIPTVRILCMGNGGADLGILVHSTPTSTGQDRLYRVAKQVREISDSFSFRNAVKAKSLPLLVMGNDLAKRGAEFAMLNGLGWVSIYDFETPSQPLPIMVRDLIFRWRTDLLHELECVGYAVTIGKIERLAVHPAFVKHEVEGEILARHSSLGRLSESGYLVVSSDVLRAAGSYRQLAYLIENFRDIAKANRTKPEEVFQSFFATHPDFLFQEQFTKVWPKPRFLLPEDPSRWLEPDFVVQPAVTPQLGSKWRLLDIKLPDVPLIKKRKFHPTFSQKLFSALQQLADYRKYFGRDDAKSHILDKLGFQPINPRLAVLIGRGPTDDVARVLDGVCDTTNILNVDIITYDEVLNSRSLRIAHELEWVKRFI